MKIAGQTVFVSGTSRGIGRVYVQELLKAGATKVYAAARDPSKVADLVAAGGGKVVAVKLDVTDPAAVTAAAKLASDVTLLINNAGVNFNTPLIGIASLDNAKAEIATNYFGTLAMCRAFAPVLKANGGGTIVNMLSILARVNLPLMGSLCASKAAELSMSQGVRAELAGQGTPVLVVMPGAVDTDMTKDLPPPKAAPLDIVKEVLAGIEAGSEEIYPGEMAKGVSGGLSADPKAVEKDFAKYLPM
jgi:NAD(P)-dependent dehydrogenase (short-subunit alcohol dehydrogenase family)